MCDAVLCLDSVNSIPFLVTWNKLFRCESYKLWMQMMCEGVGEFESLFRLFVCTNVQLIVVCLFFITYLFTLTSAFYTIFCRLTRMFFSQCAAGFLFYYGKKIQRQTMCVYVFNGYASVSVLCVLLCLNFWRSGRKRNIPLRHAHEIDTFHARLLFCCLLSDLLLLLFLLL